MSTLGQWLKKNWIYLLALTILVFVTYLNSLNNVFLSDDIAEIRDNPNIANLNFLATHAFGFLRLLFYWLIYQIGGLNPLLFRLLNIIFHLGTVILVFGLISQLYSKKAAVFAAILMAVHPALSEAIVWISGGSYAQYSFFFILSFILYIRSYTNKKLFFLSVFCLYLAFMSHYHMPLALFLVFPLYEYCFGNLKKNWKRVLPFFCLTLFYIGLTLVGLPEREATLQNVHYEERGVDNIFATIPISLTSYFQLLLWPQTLTIYHSELAFPPIDFIIRVLITLAFFGILIISFRKNKNIFFWCSFSLLALAPTLTPFRLNWIVAERYLYLPSVAFFTLLGLLLAKLSDKKNLKPVVYSIFAVVVLLLVVRTIMRNIDWSDENHLWIATGQTSPSSPNNHNNLGDVYGRLGDKQRSIQEFQTAITLKPNYADAYHNLGNAYRESGDYDKAIASYQSAIKYNPNLWQSYQNIAAIYFAAQKYDLALQNVQQAITIAPNNLNLRISEGVVYLAMGDKNHAKEVFTLILSADPQNQTARQGLTEAVK